MSIEEIKNSLLEEMNTGSQDVDYIQLNNWWALATRIINLILGILVGLLIIAIPIVCALEIAYICIPNLANGVTHLEESLSVKTNGKTNGIFAFVFRDAKRAMKEAYTEGSGLAQPLWFYLKIKVKLVVFAGIIVVLVLRGGMILPEFVQRIFSGLTDLIMSRF